MARKTDQRHASIGGWDAPGAPFRSGGGAWQPDERHIAHALQLEFWRAAIEQCPAAFEELKKIPVPESIRATWADYCQDRLHKPPREPEHVDFENRIGAWAVEHRVARERKRRLILVAPGWRPVEPAWIVGLARDWLLWCASGRRPAAPDLEAPFEMVVGWVSALTEDAPTFDPYRETEERYLKRAREYAARELERARKLGAVRAPRFSPEHLRWLARWRLGGQSPEEIARTVPVPRGNWGKPVVRVRKAIRRLATELELPPLT